MAEDEYQPRVLNADEAGRLLRALDVAGPEEAVAEPGDEVAADPDGSEHAPQPQRRIGRYVLDGMIGQGGSAGVYRAYTGGSDTPVALKLLSHSLSSEARSRALREAEVLGELRLECVPRFVESGLHHGVPFIVTELVVGQPLDVHCQSLPRERRIELLARVASAVQTLHEHGVLHRDLKPSNILIDARGRPVIVDLGLAHSSARDHTLTAEGQPLGTVAFMAPEQARGDLSGVSTRSDVYSLGAIAYQLELGQPPHDVATSIHEAIRRIAQDPPRPPLTLDPALPRPLAAVLARACAPKPADRYASAAALAEDLRRWLRGESVEAIAPGPWRRMMRWAAVHPLAVTVLLCVAVAASSLAGTVLSVRWLNARPYTVRIDDNLRAQLVSRTGKPLHEWSGREAIFGKVLERPAALGGGRIAVLAFQAGLGGDLLACDVDDPTGAVWVQGDDPGDFDIPRHETLRGPQVFAVQHAQVVDVFPESPGMEVLALHRSNLIGVASIRVYDLSGSILYEAWHHGVLYDATWLTGPGLLVLSGVNSEALWRERGHREVQKAWPWVVLAIRPTKGTRHGWITTSARKGDVKAAWYRALLPPLAAEHFIQDTQLRAQPAEEADPSTHADVLAEYVRFTINSEGLVVRKTIMATGRQSLSSPERQAFFETLHLGELPPPVIEQPGLPR